MKVLEAEEALEAADVVDRGASLALLVAEGLERTRGEQLRECAERAREEHGALVALAQRLRLVVRAAAA